MLPVQAVFVGAARHLAVEFCKAVRIQFQPAADLIVERAVEAARGAVALGVEERPSTVEIELNSAERRCGRVVAASRAIGAAAGAGGARSGGLVARASLAEHVAAYSAGGELRGRRTPELWRHRRALVKSKK